MAIPPGFEPGLIGPKPIVLPLHNGIVLSKNKSVGGHGNPPTVIL